MLKTDYKFGEAFSLVSQVAKNDSKVEFKDIMNNGNGGVALLAFCAGQELPTHQAPAEVMVYVPKERWCSPCSNAQPPCIRATFS